MKVAAEKAGFNIWDHDGLYNLIWAVKRVALRASKNANIDQKPLKDPVYPDRFRPSGFRDNTKRKRPDLPPPLPATVPVTLNPTAQVTQGDRRKFRYKNKKIPVPPKPVTRTFDWDKEGTQDHPIDLDYEDENNEPSPDAKRQRMNIDTIPSNRQIANTSYPRTALEDLSGSVLDTGTLTRPSARVARDTTQVGDQTYFRRGATAGHYDTKQSRLLKNHLTKVENALEGSANHMSWCKKSMSAAFINHSEFLGGPNIHPLLEKLNKSIDDAKASSFQGAEILKDVLDLVP